METETHVIGLVANGTIEDYGYLFGYLLGCDQIFAVDGGVQHCHTFGITPDLIIGDFDSIDPEVLDFYPQVEQKRFPSDKAETDLELAVDMAFERGAHYIILIGVTGLRMDHTASACLLLGRFPDQVIALTDQETLFALDGEAEYRTEPGQTLSLLPIYGETTITTRGLRWELTHQKLSYQHVSQSNIAETDFVHLESSEGKVLVSLHHVSSS